MNDSLSHIDPAGLAERHRANDPKNRAKALHQMKARQLAWADPDGHQITMQTQPDADAYRRIQAHVDADWPESWL